MSNEIGSFTIEACILKKWDSSKQVEISSLITEYHINENVYGNGLEGSLIIGDYVGLFSDFPIIGEEYIELEYTDGFDNTRTDLFHVYSVIKIDPAKNGLGFSYIIKLTSIDYLSSESVGIRKSYSGYISKCVEDIFNQYFTKSKKSITIEPTANYFTYVIPGFSPFEAIDFLSKKAYSDVNKSSNFLFFENRDKYHFETVENIIRTQRISDFPKSKVFKYNNPNLDLDDKLSNGNEILGFNIINNFNVLHELRNGSMVSQNYVLDISKKTYDQFPFKYHEEFDKYEHLDVYSRQYHTAPFIEEYFGVDPSKEALRKTYLYLNDTANFGDRYYKEITSSRMAYINYLTSVRLNVTINGRNDLFAGDIINIEFPIFRGDDKQILGDEHPSLSGYYFIENITHVMKIEDDSWIMDMTVVKDALRDETKIDTRPTSIISTLA